MKKRILLLALGFPARNHLERGAQLSMHEYHKQLFRCAVRSPGVLGYILCLVVLIFIPTYFIGIFVTAVIVMIVAILLRLWEGPPLEDVPSKGLGKFLELFKKGHTYHPRLSHEVKQFCEKVGIPELPVCTLEMNTEEGFSLAGIQRLKIFDNSNIIVVCEDFEYFVSPKDRRAVFAHEIGHTLLPLGMLRGEFDSKEVSHTNEFAADAIAACLLGDARLMYAFHERDLQKFGGGEGSDTHPQRSERIGRLRKIHASGQNAR